jgi:hypothetical protein
MKYSRMGVVIATLPALAMLGLFYSLAIHMHHALGAWPNSMDETGFPHLLIIHVTVTGVFFVAWFLSSILVVPVAIVACLLVRRWRRGLPYFAWCALMFFVCRGLMQLAPGQFLDWWRD